MSGPLRVIVGTAGHVDHGKTALVKALTGIDTDRLPEEKRRGITLEAGYAHLELPGIGTAGVVDVPGHERFLRAMVGAAFGAAAGRRQKALRRGSAAPSLAAVLRRGRCGRMSAT